MTTTWALGIADSTRIDTSGVCARVTTEERPYRLALYSTHASREEADRELARLRAADGAAWAVYPVLLDGVRTGIPQQRRDGEPMLLDIRYAPGRAPYVEGALSI